MNDYQNIFIDFNYPTFIDKYLTTKTLKRLKYVTQFCGADYTKLYSPLFLYTRFDHSLTVAHMTWHFTHDKKETIIALLHDVGTPCFAHVIDYVFNDYMVQESSEKSIIDVIKEDKKLLNYLKEDNISLASLNDLGQYPILENKSPKCCTDRLDGVLHTCYIWLHTHSIQEIKEVYDDIIVLKNEDGKSELGFKNVDIAVKFVRMVYNYAIELQSNTDKYINKYICEAVKQLVEKNLLTINDLYNKKEKDIIKIFNDNISSWSNFSNATTLIETTIKPNNFHVSLNVKKRNVIPLVKYNNKIQRINKISETCIKLYQKIDNYHSLKYAYLENVKNI